MNNKLFIGLVVIAVGGLVGWYFLKGSALPTTNNNQIVTTPTPSGSNLGAPENGASNSGNSMEKGGVVARSVVTYTDSGFAPSPLTVKANTTVTFVNESAGAMWVGSDPHPTHTLLAGFDQLASVPKGGSYEYTFTKVGTWTYHNHRRPSDKGQVVVTE